MLLGVPVTAVIYALVREDVAHRIPCEKEKAEETEEDE
jgi:hypothetical protein